MYSPKDYWTHDGVTRLYDDRDKRRSELIQQNKINAIIKKYKIRSVLEVGCGYGRILSKIKCNHIEGVDFSEVLLEECRKNIPGVKVGYGDITAGLAFSNKSFDMVYAIEVLLHIKPSCIENVIKEMYRISRRIMFFNTYYEDPQTLNLPYWVFLHQYKSICEKLNGIKTYEKVGEYGLDVLICKRYRRK